MPVIGQPGTQTVAIPDMWEIDGFSFHNQIAPVTMEVGEDGTPVARINAYAVVEVVAGVRQDDGTMREVARQAVRVEGDAFMAAVSANPGLFALMTWTLYGALQQLGHIPAGDVPKTDEERAAVALLAGALLSEYGG